MPYTRTFEKASDAELAIFRHEARHCYASIGYIVLFFGLGSSIALWFVFGWIGGLISDSWMVHGHHLGILAGAAICIISIAGLIRSNRDRRDDGIKDLQRGEIEVLEVKASAVVRIGLINDNEPILCFQIDSDKILYLQGQYMYDPHIYGQENESSASESEDLKSVNCMSGKMAFPNSGFIIRRLPLNGRVLGITLNGEEMDYGAEIDALKPGYNFPDSIVIHGSLEFIPEALDRAIRLTSH